MKSAVRASTVFAVLIIAFIAYTNYKDNSEVGSITQNIIEVRAESKEVVVNGKKLEIKEVPYINGESFMIPIKEVIVALDGAFEFKKSIGVFTIDYNLTKINAYINSNYVFIESTRKKLKAAPTLKNGNVFVSEQFLVDIFGFEMEKTKNGVTLVKQFVVFKEPDIENFVKNALNKEKGYFTKEELQQISTVKLNDKGIKNLEGIKYFTNIKVLELKNNKLSDISQLKYLKNLVEVNLSNNLITDIGPLASCTKLVSIDVSRNLIEGVSGFGLLQELRRINLSKNCLGHLEVSFPESVEFLDLSSNDFQNTELITRMTNLKTLILNNNPIMNIDSLYGFSNLRVVYLWGYISISDIKKDIDLIEQKSNEVLKKLDLEKKSNYLKALRIYDEILYNANYSSGINKSDGSYRADSRPSAIFTRGGGNSSALSQLFHILLRKNDIECYTYDGYVELSGKRVTHTWNVVNLGKQYYYSDIALGYMLGLDNYGHAFFNVSGRQFLSTHPKGVMQQFFADSDTFLSGGNYSRGWTTHKDELYDNFASGIMNAGSKYKLTSLTRDNAMYTISDDNFVYYRNVDDGGKLYNLDIHGNNRKKINDDQPMYLYSDVNYIYYINSGVDSNSQKGCICRYSKKDGIKEVISKNVGATWMALKGKYIYHKSIANAGQLPGLYVMDKDGDNQKPIVEDALPMNKEFETNFNTYSKEDVFLDGDLIYYTNSSDNNKIYTVKLSGKSRKKLTEERGKVTEILEDYVYYKGNNGFFRLKKDGTGKTALKTGN